MSPAPFSRTFIEVVREQAARAPQAVALVCAQGRYTYADLAARAARAAGALHAAGLRAGDRMGLLVGNRVEWIDLFLGASAVGVVTVPLSTWSTRSELEFLVQDAGLSLLAAQARFGERDFEADLQSLQGKPGMPAPGRVWLLDSAERRYEALLEATQPVTDLPPGEAASAGSDALVEPEV